LISLALPHVHAARWSQSVSVQSRTSFRWSVRLHCSSSARERLEAVPDGGGGGPKITEFFDLHDPAQIREENLKWVLFSLMGFRKACFSGPVSSAAIPGRFAPSAALATFASAMQAKCFHARVQCASASVSCPDQANKQTDRQTNR
jgi:murein endopeptidase